jgi:uncharacterized protein (TIGR03437 family)
MALESVSQPKFPLTEVKLELPAPFRRPCMHKGIFFGLLFSNSLLVAQSVAGSGYLAPAPVSVAPGQIATFYVAGLTSMTGITATLQQSSGNTTAPIQSLRTVSLCPGLTAPLSNGCGSLAAVTVQIPYELVSQCPLCSQEGDVNIATLLISQNGQAGTAIELNPLADEVHVLTACDVALAQSPYSQPVNLTGLPCAPLVAHADGSLVTASSPASIGEALTAWVFGLGLTNPTPITGQPSVEAPATEPFYLNFNYQVNALPTKPYYGEPNEVPLAPLYAGLAPGYVGLYQVNFTVPAQPPNGTPHCSIPGLPTPAADMAQSNLTVSIGGQYSFDGTGICVATQIPVD